MLQHGFVGSIQTDGKKHIFGEFSFDGFLGKVVVLMKPSTKLCVYTALVANIYIPNRQRVLDHWIEHRLTERNSVDCAYSTSNIINYVISAFTCKSTQYIYARQQTRKYLIQKTEDTKVKWACYQSAREALISNQHKKKHLSIFVYIIYTHLCVCYKEIYMSKKLYVLASLSYTRILLVHTFVCVSVHTDCKLPFRCLLILLYTTVWHQQASSNC